MTTQPKYWLWLSVSLMLQGCAVPVGQTVYTGVSAVSMITTAKGVPEHAVGAVSGADCSALNYLVGDRDYVCELPRDPATTYNRNVF